MRIPPVGESITSGVVSVWHKKSGEYVDAGEALLTFETDKVATEITAEKAGVIETKVDQGQEVKIGEVVAVIDDQATAPAKSGGTGSVHPSLQDGRSGSRLLNRLAAKSTTFTQRRHSFPSGQENDHGRTRSIPRKSAAPAKAAGSRKATSFRICKQSRRLRLTIRKSRGRGKTPGRAGREGEERFTRKKMSPLRRKIAAQLVMAQQTAAILTTFNECDMSEVMALRKKAQEKFQADHGVKLGFMSFFIKATVEGLKAVPAINSRIEGDDFILNHYYDIGVAVGTERGLVVPVVRDADKKSFADLERDVADFATRARDGKIKIEDLQGGTFTISNGGVYGSLMGTPILNPPQSGILGMHAIQERPVAREGRSGRQADDVSRAELRSPRGRRQGSGHVSRQSEGSDRKSDRAAARLVTITNSCCIREPAKKVPLQTRMRNVPLVNRSRAR